MDLQTKDLDEEELLQLAILASQTDRHDQAISYLKSAIEKNPEDANAVYFLAAEHAQIGLYERAIRGMERTLEIDPDMHVARFQLGLLYLTSGLPVPAMATLEPLAELGEDQFFGCFALGLCHLIRDEFIDCKRLLEKGIGLNQVNLPLNGDMQKILEMIRDKVAESPAEEGDAVQAPQDAAVGAAGNLWLSEYQKGETEH